MVIGDKVAAWDSFCHLRTATYKAKINMIKEKRKRSKMILSFLGAWRMFVTRNPFPRFDLRGRSYSFSIFLGLPGPDFFSLGVATNFLLGLHGPVFFLFGIYRLL